MTESRGLVEKVIDPLEEFGGRQDSTCTARVSGDRRKTMPARDGRNGADHEEGDLVTTLVDTTDRRCQGSRCGAANRRKR